MIDVVSDRETCISVVEREKATFRFGKPDRLIRRDWDPFPETIARWEREGWDGNYERFHYDQSPYFSRDELNGEWDNVLVELTGVDVPVIPAFETKIAYEDEGYIYFQTTAGGIEKFKRDKPRGSEIMPEFHKMPVECKDDWYKKIKPRLDPDTPERWINFVYAGEAAKQVGEGLKLYAGNAMGGYMYLRAMLGPEQVMYSLYDDPDMIHDMMKTWLHLVKTCLMRTQDKVPFFKIFIGEDIAYKTDLLISPEMIREFLTPYYFDLINTLKNRQDEEILFELDSDGNMKRLIPIYKEMGFKVFDPFEIAAGNDIVQIGKEHPDIIIKGGIDKRILGKSKEAIKQYLDSIVPYFTKRGGFIPTCDHFIPSTVSFENYQYYRDLMVSMDKC